MLGQELREQVRHCDVIHVSEGDVRVALEAGVGQQFRRRYARYPGTSGTGKTMAAQRMRPFARIGFMNGAQRILLFLAATLLISACSREDPVIFVSDDDPEMVAAIAKARDTLPKFWQAFEKPGEGESDFSLKVKITEGQDAEYFWLIKLERVNGKTFGIINNDP